MAPFQGTLLSIRTSVIGKLRLDTADDTARVDEAINLAYQDAVQQTGCLQRTGTATLTTGVSSFTLPASVAWIKSLTLTYADGSITDPLQQVPLDTILEQRRATVAAGQSVVQPVYSLVGQNQLELWPTPGAGQSMVFWYVYLPDELSGDSDEPVILEPFGSKLLEYGALVELARFKKDPLLADYEAAFQVWLSKFQVWLNRREGASPAKFRVYGGGGSIRYANPSTDVGGVWGL